VTFNQGVVLKEQVWVTTKTLAIYARALRKGQLNVIYSFPRRLDLHIGNPNKTTNLQDMLL